MGCLSFGDGALPLRKVHKILKAHGYYIDRCSGDHRIYKNASGDSITIAPKCATPQIKRLFKEHSIDKNILERRRK